jgi:hypothetical protein
MKFVKTYEDQDCQEVEVYNDENEKIAYYVMTETPKKSSYEVYYDFDAENEEFTCSYVFDDFKKFKTFLMNLVIKHLPFHLNRV